MVKKLFLISAVLLSTTGAWATDAPTVSVGSTVRHNGVNYEITSSDATIGTLVTGTATTEVTYANGVVTYTTGRTDTQNKTYTMIVTATTADTSATAVVVENFTNNVDITENGKTNGTTTYTPDASQYYTKMSDAADATSDYTFLTYAQTQTDLTGYTYGYNYMKDNQNLTSNLENYYYVKLVTNDYYRQYVAIDEINVVTDIKTVTTWNCSYTNTAIAANFLTSDVVSTVTFNAEVQDIAAGAFQGATALTTVTPASTTYFEWNSKVQYLYKKESVNGVKTNTTIVVAGIYSPTNTLKDEVSTIYNYAFANVQKDDNDKNIVITSNNYDISVDTKKQGENVTFDIPLKYTCTAEGLGYKITNTVKNADLETIFAKGGLFYDFSNARIWDELTINNSEATNNILYYFPAGTTVNGTYKNVVIGGTCANLILTDKMPFYNKTAFTATNAFLNRSMPSNTWATVIVPFTCPVSGTDYIGDYYAYTDGKLCFKKASQLNANTPYMYLNSKSSAVTPFKVEGSNVTVPVTNPQTVEPTTGAKFIGTLSSTLTLNSGYDYAYTSGGTFIKCAGNSLPPFRAYFYVNTGSGSAPGMRFFDEYDNEIEFENVTGINEVSEEENSNVIYNVNGQLVDNMDKPGVYVVNGKKVIVK